jgi:hypothetical protein
MPLAQNYIDDVSLVESEGHLKKTTMDTESDLQQRFHIDMNNVSFRKKKSSFHFFLFCVSYSFIYLKISLLIRQKSLFLFSSLNRILINIVSK